MRKNELSIIVPCYNGEKYIKKFFINIQKQTFQDYELIIIDDQSKDKSYEILTKYKSDKIKIFKNNKNLGAGKTRNIGIEKSSGRYIVFIDIDDIFPKNYLEELYNCIINKECDMVVCQIKSSDGNKIGFKEGLIKKKELLKSPYAASVWGKIIKRKIVENNLFPIGIINEDVPAIIGAIIDSDSICYTERTFYEYINNQNSVQNSNFSIRKFDIFKAIDILKSQKNIDDFIEEIEYNQLILFYLYMVLNEVSGKKRVNYIRIFYENYHKRISDNRYYNDFVKRQNKINKIYYSIVVNLCDYHLFKIASAIVGVRQKLRKIKRIIVK